MGVCHLSDDLAEHVPGASNTVCDALSRLMAPEPTRFPEELTRVPRVRAPAMEWRADTDWRGPAALLDGLRRCKRPAPAA